MALQEIYREIETEVWSCCFGMWKEIKVKAENGSWKGKQKIRQIRVEQSRNFANREQGNQVRGVAPTCR